MIRRAEPEDAASLLEYVRGVIAEGNFTFRDSLDITEEDEREYISNLVSPQTILVAHCTDDIIGLATLTSLGFASTRHRAKLSISVHRDHRHQGIGSTLLQAILDFATSDPTLRQIELTVFTDNPIAIKFYEPFGFTLLGLTPRSICRNGTYVDGQLMYRDTK